MWAPTLRDEIAELFLEDFHLPEKTWDDWAYRYVQEQNAARRARRRLPGRESIHLLKGFLRVLSFVTRSRRHWQLERERDRVVDSTLRLLRGLFRALEIVRREALPPPPPKPRPKHPPRRRNRRREYELKRARERRERTLRVFLLLLELAARDLRATG